MKRIFEKISLHRIHSSDGHDYIEIEILHNRKIVQRIHMDYQEFGAFLSGESEVEIKAEVY
jgi:hypothetical protein